MRYKVVYYLKGAQYSHELRCPEIDDAHMIASLLLASPSVGSVRVHDTGTHDDILTWPERTK